MNRINRFNNQLRNRSLTYSITLIIVIFLLVSIYFLYRSITEGKPLFMLIMFPIFALLLIIYQLFLKKKYHQLKNEKDSEEKLYYHGSMAGAYLMGGIGIIIGLFIIIGTKFKYPFYLFSLFTIIPGILLILLRKFIYKIDIKLINK